MKRGIFILLITGLAVWAVSSCSFDKIDNPYEEETCAMDIVLDFPKAYDAYPKENAEVSIREVNRTYDYSGRTDANGVAHIILPKGLYRIVAKAEYETSVLNGTRENIKFTKKQDSVHVKLLKPTFGKIVVKEVYSGGCKKLPADGDYQSDKYVMLHNNHTETVYLDGFCFGTLEPYNSTGTLPWGTIPDFAPVTMAVWEFAGSGTSFPLKPGEDAVICLCGAVDHTQTYPLSVNLNRPGYFVCYDFEKFWNVTYHPQPGDQIQKDHYVRCVSKIGRASTNAYTFSVSSPTFVLFKPDGMTIDEFLKQEGALVDIPGQAGTKAAAIPWEWIEDGVEVFTSKGADKKRIRSDVDAGYVVLSESFQGHSLMRKVDEKETAARGYEVLLDTNNSSRDLYERETASLHKTKE